MHISKKSLVSVLILALVLIGFYTVDLTPDKASIISFPDFDTSVTDSKDTPINTLGDFNNAIVNITDKTNPTVVTITTTQRITPRDNPLLRFFNMPQEQQEFTRQGLGSGVIVSKEGYILTNNHVVEGADQISVRMFNEKSAEAEVVGRDPQTDIAVLKIKADNLPVISLGNSDDLRVGELVLAIGSPLDPGLAHSVSMGIVSAKGRSRLGLASYENYIQTDAAINPGNSGGALINMDGELIGINTAIASRSGGYQGVGFAIPINLAKQIMNSLIETGEVKRGYLGIYLGGTVDETMARALGLEEARGFIIGQVEEGGPADEAGLKEGDIIVSLNGKPVDSWDAFRIKIANTAPGSEVTVGVIRDEEEMSFDVTLGELDGSQTASSEPQADIEEQLGFNARNLTPNIADQLGLSSDVSGVVVTGVQPGSPAYRQGLRKGDVITSVNRQNISNLNEFNEIMSQLIDQEDQVILLKVNRQGINQFIAFEL